MTSPKKSIPHSPRPELYGLWCGMIGRCYNSNHSGYVDYGGRGITVCQRWRGHGGFERFVADMGPRPSKDYSIERMNNNKGYSPSNCKWATAIEQTRNVRSNRNITFNGKTQCIAAWADELGVSWDTLRSRFDRGWPIKRVLTTVVGSPMITSRNLTFKGKTQSVTMWARELGVHSGILFDRLRKGWSVQRILTEPARQQINSRSI